VKGKDCVGGFTGLMVKFFTCSLLWAIPSRQLGTTKLLAHPTQWDRGQNQKGKSVKIHALR